MVSSPEKQIEELEETVDALTRERDELAVVVDSVKEIVRVGWVYRQEACPFCRGLFKHKAFCYLNSQAGALVLSEYADIERQRDFLLSRVKQLTGKSVRPAKQSLKARFSRNGRA